MIQPLNAESSKRDLLKADATPISVDTSISWDSIGGLKQHITALKEMIVLPLLYPEIFQKFHVTPPRGVLFVGPPGTGKTLVARALCNSCSIVPLIHVVVTRREERRFRSSCGKARTV